MSGGDPSSPLALLAPLTSEPERSAILLDLDGTLAPIVERPEDAALPGHTRELLEAIAGRFAVAGLVTGRRAAEARRIAGVEGLTVVGSHGLERLDPGSDEARPMPALADVASAAPAFVAAIDPRSLSAAGLRVEDKGAIAALHWRGAEDEEGAERTARRIAAEAERAGLATHSGRKVIELRPGLAFDKGIGIGALLSDLDLDHALYAGDDRTDVDGFGALERLRAEGKLRSIARIAVVDEESPAEVEASADLAVAGPEGFVAVLERLAKGP